MNLKILCWNVRGLNVKDKRMVIKSFVKSVRADIICFQETKMEMVDRGLIWKIWGGHFVE